jgi:hypothetical protein
MTREEMKARTKVIKKADKIVAIIVSSAKTARTSHSA